MVLTRRRILGGGRLVVGLFERSAPVRVQFVREDGGAFGDPDHQHAVAHRRLDHLGLAGDAREERREVGQRRRRGVRLADLRVRGSFPERGLALVEESEGTELFQGGSLRGRDPAGRAHDANLDRFLHFLRRQAGRFREFLDAWQVELVGSLPVVQHLR